MDADDRTWAPKEYEFQLVVLKDPPGSNYPRFLGVLMPRRPGDDEDLVRYHDTSPAEEEHFAHGDEVEVVTVKVEV